MKFTADELKIITDTVSVVGDNIDKIVSVFYDDMLNENPELINIFNTTNQKNNLQRLALANSIVAYGLNIKNPEKLQNIIDAIATKHVSIGIMPEQYNIVGKYLMHAIDKVIGPLPKNIIEVWEKVYWSLAEILINKEKTLYNNSVINEGWIGWKEFIVFKKEKHNEIITSFYLKPKDNSQIPKFSSGQYISIKVFLKDLGFEQIRQYSISCEENHEYLKITIKKEDIFDDKLMVSNYMHDKVNINDTLLISAPHGSFKIKNDKNQMVFIAGGIGVTPMLSMIETMKDRNDIDLLFVYSFRDEENAIELKKLVDISKQNSRIKNIFYSTDKQSELAHFSNTFIDFNYLKDFFKINADFYICGPDNFIKFSINELKKLNITDDNIHYETFSPNLALK